MGELSPWMYPALIAVALELLRDDFPWMLGFEIVAILVTIEMLIS